MPDIFIILLILCFMALVYSGAKIVQLSKFSKYMHVCLEELYEGEKWKSIQLNINQSYYNFDKSSAWNYDFQKMVVYESRRAA